MSLYFCTPTNIDLTAVFTFGINAKENDNAIGYFGTGLKYATATLLRTSHALALFTGGDEFEIEDRHFEFRGKEFRKVFLGDRELGFTTELGKNWEVWMAFRELHSNTLDELGFTTDDSKAAFDWCADRVLKNLPYTMIEVKGSAIALAYQQRDIIFCASSIVAKSGELEVRAGRSSYIYYRGVRAFDLGSPSMFTYNITKECRLSEDRFLMGGMDNYSMGRMIAQLGDVACLRTILTAPEGVVEAVFDFDPCDPSDEFFQAFQQCANDARVNKTARALMMRKGKIIDKEVELDAIQRQQLDNAVGFLKAIGHDVSRYPIKVVELLGPLGMAKEGIIYISPAAFRMGTKYVAGTLYEEFIHLSEGVFDETRAMQNILIDTIMSMGERLIGRPI